MTEIFMVEGSDRRKEFLAAMESGDEFVAQRTTGKEVQYFSPSTGFVLLRSEEPIQQDLRWVRKVEAVAKLSLGPRLELREFYYTMRGQEDLVRSFNPNDVYGDVLGAINAMEIVCDIEREDITVGNLPKGLIYYGHQYGYDNKEKPIGFTENLARKVLTEHDIKNAMSIIEIEKSAAATRLVSMGFSELTNSVITTTGGFFTRAIYALAERFKDTKNLIFFCDGDVYGNSMLRAVEYGAAATPHLTPRQAFPSSVNPNIYIAGLYPSVAEKINLPNDVETKRPLSSPTAQAMVRFFGKYNLVDERDIATWQRDNTYELEALSTSFKNRQQEPIGLGIYLLEYMRLKNLPLKPQPSEDSDLLKDDLEVELKDVTEETVEAYIKEDSPASDIRGIIDDEIGAAIDAIKQDVLSDIEDDLMTSMEDTTAEAIRSQLLMQYQNHPRQEIYNLRDLALKMRDIKVKVNWNKEELVEKVRETVHQYIEDLKAAGNLYEVEEAEFTPLDDVTRHLENFYDVVEKELQADPKDAEKIREALKERLS